GVAPGPGARYLHLGAAQAEVVLGTGARVPYVRFASGFIEQWQRSTTGARFVLVSYGDAEFTLAGARGCRVAVDGTPIVLRGDADEEQRYELERRDAATTPRRYLVDIDCRR
ncbi:MAG: hypothetical protein N2483_07815, partial [Burkholderiaceae bacterium]|nr:hypothetical protein [Burkholderiaceae bacterium]